MKAILFDFDGTLIDSAPDLAYAANRLMQVWGLREFSIAEIAGFIGNGIPKLVERVMMARDMPLDKHQAVTEEFIAIYQLDPTSRTIIFPHVPQVLKALKSQNFMLGLCTNKAESATQLILKNLNLAEYFDAVIGGNTTKALKPDPAPLFAALDILGVAAQDAVFIGDSQVDMIAAQNADMRFWFYQGGYCHIDPAKIVSDWQFSDFMQLQAKLVKSL